MRDIVTWLLPVRNGMPYLSETLASIEAQTYKRWQIIACDDGSTDNTLGELKRWIPSRLPGRILSGKPMGVGSALAQMVAQCETELCARIDADDVNLPRRLEQQIEFLYRNPEVAVVGSQMYCIDAKGEKRKHLYSVPLSHNDIVHAMLIKNSIAHPTVLFKKSFVLKAGNYQSFPNVEDYDLWLRLAKIAKLANIDQPLVCYRVHDKSETQMAHARREIAYRLNDRFYEHASSLYGCSENEAKLLRERKHPFSMGILYKISKHLQVSQSSIKGIESSSYLSRLRSASFVNSARYLTSSRDIFSHFCLSALDPNKAEMPLKLTKFIARSLKDSLSKAM